VPPPNYEPEPDFAPAGGFPPETPVQERIVPAVFIYAPGPAFLRNIEEPYTPECSYMNSGEMLAAEEAEAIYALSEAVSNFIAEVANPELVADWGPPLDEVAECTGVAPVTLVNTAYRYPTFSTYYYLSGCYPPQVILTRRHYLVGMLPPPAWRYRPLPVVAGARRPIVYKADVVKLPSNLPTPKPIPAKVTSPLVKTAALTPGKPHPALALPPKTIGRIGAAGPRAFAPKGPQLNPGAVPPVKHPRSESLLQKKMEMEKDRQTMKLPTPQKPKERGEDRPFIKPKSKDFSTPITPKTPTPGPLPEGRFGPRADGKDKPFQTVKPPDSITPKHTPGGPSSPSGPSPKMDPREFKKVPPAGQAPPTPEQLKQQREEEKKQQLDGLRKKQQNQFGRPPSPPSAAPGQGTPPDGGTGLKGTQGFRSPGPGRQAPPPPSAVPPGPGQQPPPPGQDKFGGKGRSPQGPPPERGVPGFSTPGPGQQPPPPGRESPNMGPGLGLPKQSPPPKRAMPGPGPGIQPPGGGGGQGSLFRAPGGGGGGGRGAIPAPKPKGGGGGGGGKKKK